MSRDSFILEYDLDFQELNHKLLKYGNGFILVFLLNEV